MQSDVLAENHGSVYVLTPLSEDARNWFADNVVSEPWQWMGASLCIEPRYAGEIVDGLTATGLTVERD